MNPGRRIFHFILVFGLILAFGMRIQAQEIEGTITGTVKDATGAVVPDALVKQRTRRQI